MDIKKELGSNIKKFRKSKKLTQEQLAELINIAPRTLYGIENGKNFVTAETLEKIITVLEITSSDLFTKQENLSSAEISNYLKSKIDNLANNPQKLNLIYKIFKVICDN